jgi:2-dehydro-3-deoxyglucarate aldolase
MDAGSCGVIVPNVNSAEDARKAVEGVRYPPFGKRGVGLARAQGYGLEFEEYKDWLKDNSIVVVQIEHIEGVNNLEQILKTDGVDATIIGPYDLSASMGHPGDFEYPKVKEALKKYVEVCKRLGKSAGFHIIIPDADRIKGKVKEGFNFLAFSTDALLLAHKCRDELSKIRKGLL